MIAFRLVFSHDFLYDNVRVERWRHDEVHLEKRWSACVIYALQLVRGRYYSADSDSVILKGVCKPCL